MIYVIYFSEAGAPKTGLTPTVTVYKKVSDGSDVGSPPSVTTIGGGFYKFTAAPSEALVVQVDGGAALANPDRYKVMQITPNDGGLDASVSSRAPEAGGNVAAIKAKTDNLPADPASNAQVNTRLATAGYTAPDNAAITAIKGKTDNLPGAPANETTLAAVKAKTDNLPAQPANEANVETHVTNALNAYDPPTRAEATADKEAVIGQVDANEAKIDVLDALADAIKAKTDLLPADPASQAAVLAAVAGLNDITVAELLSGNLADAQVLAANSLGDLVRKIFWVLCNRLVISDATGAFTGYKGDGVTPAVTGTIEDDGATTERSVPTWP
jgi:hypothetical protein